MAVGKKAGADPRAQPFPSLRSQALDWGPWVPRPSIGVPGDGGEGHVLAGARSHVRGGQPFLCLLQGLRIRQSRIFCGLAFQPACDYFRDLAEIIAEQILLKHL